MCTKKVYKPPHELVRSGFSAAARRLELARRSILCQNCLTVHEQYQIYNAICSRPVCHQFDRNSRFNSRPNFDPVLPRSDRKALSGVSDWVDSTQSLVPGLYWKTSPWYNLNCTKGLGGIHPVPETWFDGSKDSSGATYQAISINTDGRAIPPLPTDIGLGPH